MFYLEASLKYKLILEMFLTADSFRVCLHESNSNDRFNFLVLLRLFDVEVVFFYPYAVNFKGLGWDGFWAVLMFVGFFLAGFIYIIRKGALHWEE